MNCMESLVKYILFIFNIIFLVCGILLIILGGIMLGNMSHVQNFDEVVNLYTIPILIIVLGSIVFVISFFGCCGAIRENTCCINIYAVFMFIIFCCQLALVVWTFVEYNEFLNTLDKGLQDVWNKNNAANGYPMNGFELSFNCCGLHGSNDYTGQGMDVPKACCGSLDKSCPAAIYSTKNGCAQEFHDFWATNMNIIRYAGIAVALIELIAFILACCLASGIRRSRGSSF